MLNRLITLDCHVDIGFHTLFCGMDAPDCPEAHAISYKPYFPLFVALPEIPILYVGLWLAKDKAQTLKLEKTLKEIFLHQAAADGGNTRWMEGR